MRYFTHDLPASKLAALSYVLKSGCQWRMLPGDFPNWPVVYKYFQQWGQKTSEEVFSLLEQALKNGVGAVRDAQCVKNTDPDRKVTTRGSTHVEGDGKTASESSIAVAHHE